MFDTLTQILIFFSSDERKTAWIRRSICLQRSALHLSSECLLQLLHLLALLQVTFSSLLLQCSPSCLPRLGNLRTARRLSVGWSTGNSSAFQKFLCLWGPWRTRKCWLWSLAGSYTSYVGPNGAKRHNCASFSDLSTRTRGWSNGSRCSAEWAGCKRSRSSSILWCLSESCLGPPNSMDSWGILRLWHDPGL